MKCKVNKKQLKEILLAHSKVIKSKEYILSGVKLEVAGGELIVTTTNLEQVLESRLEAHNCIIGKALIPFKTFKDTVSQADDTVVIETGQVDGKDTVKVDSLDIVAMEMAEYPETQEPVHYTVTQFIDFNDFKDMADKLKDCISTDQGRIVLTGMYFDTEYNQVVATDSYKMALYNLPFKTAGLKSFIVPGEVIPIIEKIKYDDLQIHIKVENSLEYACIEIGDHSLYTRLWTGKFPGYRPSIEVADNYLCRLDAGKLGKVIGKANKMLKDKDMPAILDFNCTKAEVTKTVKEVGKFTGSVDIQPLKQDQEPIKVALNSNYLEGILKKYSGDITVKIQDTLRPVSIHQDAMLEYIIMPIRVSQEVDSL